MTRGRGRGRGGGRGRGRRRSTVETTNTVAHDDGDDALPSSFTRTLSDNVSSAVTRLSSSSSATNTIAKRGRGGHSGTRSGGRGQAASRESTTAAVEEGKPIQLQNVVHVVSATSSSDGLPSQHQQPLITTPPPVVVVVPQGRMITRSLLRGTSPLLISDLADSQRRRSSSAHTISSSTVTVGGRRKRANAPTAATGDTELSLLPTETHSLKTPSSSSPAFKLLVDSPAIAPVSLTSSFVNVTAAAGATGAPPSSPAQRVVIGGLLRCVCNAFLVSPSETLLECSRCRNWCHPACVGVDVEDLRLYQRHRNYVCPLCAPSAQAAETVTLLTTSSSILPMRNEEALKKRTLMKRQADAFPTKPVQQQQQQASITTALGESIPVVFSTNSAGPPSLSSTFTGAASPTHSIDDAPKSQQTTAAAAPPTMAGVSTTSPASHGFPLANRPPPAPRQLPQKLRDVPDARPPPALAERLEELLHALERTAAELGYTVLHFPAHQLTEAQMAQSLACCEDAIREATFSADYPAYCLKGVQQRRHPYVQGTALQSNHENVICSFVLSNGRDFYGNMRGTITQMKSALHRGFLHPDDVSDFMGHCLTISDVSDFVHITLSATHARYQRKGLARLLMAMELLKWALRGRTRAFLNMAIEKHLVDNGTRIELASPAASRRLYTSFGFTDVFPRYDPVTKKERWTVKEADSGRVMANVSFVDDVLRVAAALPAKCQSASHRINIKDACINVADGKVHVETPTGAASSQSEQESTQGGAHDNDDDGSFSRTRNSTAVIGTSPAPASRRSLFSDSPDVTITAAVDAGRDARKRHRSASPLKNTSSEVEA